MSRRLALAVALCAAALLGVTSPVPAQAPQHGWKAGTVAAGGNPLNDTMKLLAEQLATT